MQISFAVTAKLISAFVFATQIVQSLYFQNPKFQASNHLLRLYSLVCVIQGRKPRRPIFSQRGSNIVVAALVAEWVRSLYFSALNHSIISPLCLVWVRAPHWPHLRQAKYFLRVCQVVFPGYSRFAPPTDWLVSTSEIILKGTLN